MNFYKAQQQVLQTERLFSTMEKSDKTKDELDFIYSQMKLLKYFNPFIEQFLKGTNKDTILEVLLDNCAYFQLCSNLKIETFQGGDIIFEEGAISNNKLYIIWSGSVMLMRQRKLEVLQKEEQMQKTIAKYMKDSDRVHLHTVSLLTLTHARGQLKKKNTLWGVQKIDEGQRSQLIERYGSVLRELERGDGFGEKALIERTKRTLSVVVSSTQLQLIVLNKEDFMIVQKAVEISIKEKQLLVFSIFQGVLNEYSSVRLESMIYSFQSEEVEKGKLLCQEDMCGDKFYIIQSGDVIVGKNKEIDNELELIPITILCNLFFFYKKKKPARGSIFGEEIVLQNYYDYTVTVKSLTVTVMAISKYHFQSKFPPECQKAILNIMKGRVDQRRVIYENLVSKRRKQKEQIKQFKKYKKIIK